MADYSLNLALFDFIPVALSALGLWWLAGILAQALPESRRLLQAAVVLVVAGGLSKATWKLIWVLSQTDLVLLSNLLFILIAPGMLLLVFHVGAALRVWAGRAPGRPARRAALLIVLVAAAALAGAAANPEGRTWFFILLGAAALANIAISGLLIRFAWRQREWLTASLFLFSIALILLLSGLAPVAGSSAAAQWLEESLNVLAQGSFALAVWRLRGAIRGRS